MLLEIVCDSYLNNIFYFVKNILTIIMIVVPILLIVFGIYSFFIDKQKDFKSGYFPLGKAGYNMKIRIVDKDNIVKDCEEGVFAMRGKNIFSGFWNAPFMTSSYLQKGWTIFDLQGCKEDGIFYVKL